MSDEPTDTVIDALLRANAESIERLESDLADMRFRLSQMTTRKEMWQKRATRNATLLHDLERQNRVLQARLTLLENAGATLVEREQQALNDQR